MWEGEKELCGDGDKASSYVTVVHVYNIRCTVYSTKPSCTRIVSCSVHTERVSLRFSNCNTEILILTAVCMGMN